MILITILFIIAAILIAIVVAGVAALGGSWHLGIR